MAQHLYKLSTSLYGRPGADGKTVTLYLLITITGFPRKKVSLHITLPKKNYSDGKLKGKSAEVDNANRAIKELEDQLNNAFYQILEESRMPDPDLLLAEYKNGMTKDHTLLEVMNGILQDKRDMAKKEMASKHLIEKFQVLNQNLKSFMVRQYSRNDLYLKEINLDFLNKFAKFLLDSEENSVVTTNKKMGNLNQGLVYAVNNGWMKVNPMKQWKSYPEPTTNHEHLNAEQFKELLKFKYPNPTHEKIRDMFVFMCLTGMTFSHMQSMTARNLVTLEGGVQMISYVRNKTIKYKTTPIYVPVLPMTAELIEKYQRMPRYKSTSAKLKTLDDPIFPSITNQVFNRKLKDLFEFNSISLDFDISAHAARKTFANIVVKLMSMDKASAFLGHSSVGITEESYANNNAIHLAVDRAKELHEKFEEFMTQ